MGINDQRRQQALRILNALHLRDPARFVRATGWVIRSGRLKEELSVATRTKEPSAIPGPRLLYLTQGTLSAVDYHDAGRLTAGYISRIFDRVGLPITSSTRILDFGCGVGRAMRWMADAAVEGCDYNPRLVAWCAANLGHPVACNGAAPPTPYQTNSFDGLYSLSVMTHLSPSDQEQWMKEWRRIVRPGGMILATFLGPSHVPDSIAASELAANGHYMRVSHKPGDNLRGTWNTASDVINRIGQGMQLVLNEERGIPHSDQDVYIFLN